MALLFYSSIWCLNKGTITISIIDEPTTTQNTKRTSIQHTTPHHNTRQCKITHLTAPDCDAIYNTLYRNALQHNAMEHYTTHHNAMHCNTMQCNTTYAVRCNPAQHNTPFCTLTILHTQRNTTSHHRMDCCVTQRNSTQCNTT
jgi:hypothetical protein